MKKVLFATKNPAKIKYYADELKKYGYEIYTISDLNVDIDVEENGKDGVENAIIKVKAYQNICNMITIAIDDNLYFEDLEDSKQPGTNVRRVNGKRLNDEEMLKYYTNLVKEYGINGEKLSAVWIKGVAIYDGKNIVTSSFKRNKVYFKNTQSKIVHDGYPLDSISFIPKYNKYISELNKEELSDYKNEVGNKDIFNFIIDTLNKM